MKVLAFTDVHGDLDALKKLKKKAKDVDVVISAGDLTVFEDNMELLIKELDKFGKPVMIIHGNHEFDEAMESLCKKTKNVKFIHEKHEKLEDVIFLGYGGGGFNFETHEFENIGKKFKEKIKDQKVVFVIHGPPYNTNVDEILEDHVGNLTMREFIDDANPDVVVCGHLHENFGKHDVLGTSYIINPGPEGKVFDI